MIKLTFITFNISLGDNTVGAGTLDLGDIKTTLFSEFLIEMDQMLIFEMDANLATATYSGERASQDAATMRRSGIRLALGGFSSGSGSLFRLGLFLGSFFSSRSRSTALNIGSSEVFEGSNISFIIDKDSNRLQNIHLYQIREFCKHLPVFIN